MYALYILSKIDDLFIHVTIFVHINATITLRQNIQSL